jgi:hypothetical protein
MNRHHFDKPGHSAIVDELDRIVATQPATPFISIGARVTIGGRTFQAIEAQPYRRTSDGAESQLITWRGTCATCGAPYEHKGGRRPVGLPVNCPAHRGRRTRHSKRRRELRDAIALAIAAIDAGDVARARELLAGLVTK